MIKGGGAALTREKIVADLAERFVCIADEIASWSTCWARYPLPVEVIAMAAAQVARRFAALGGTATLRAGVITDNGHPLLDVRGLTITDPLAMESRDQPVAGRGDGGHLRPPPRQRVPAGHAAGRADAGVLIGGTCPDTRGPALAKPNYSFEKRQRELAKKKKKEEKDKEKAARKAAGLPPAADEPDEDEPPVAAGSARLRLARRRPGPTSRPARHARSSAPGPRRRPDPAPAATACR